MCFGRKIVKKQTHSMWHSLVLSVPYRRAREKMKHSTFRIKMNSRPSPSEGHTHIYNQPHNVTSSLFSWALLTLTHHLPVGQHVESTEKIITRHACITTHSMHMDTILMQAPLDSMKAREWRLGNFSN